MAPLLGLKRGHVQVQVQQLFSLGIVEKRGRPGQLESAFENQLFLYMKM
jgi:hypothetical protein